MSKRVISAILTLKDKDFSSGVRKAAQTTDDFQRRMKYAQNQAKRFANNTVSHFKTMAVGVAGAIATAFAIDKIKDLTVSAIESAASAQALQSQFDQVFSGIEQKATNTMNNIAKETGILPSRLQGSFTKIAAFAKTTGMDTTNALELAQRATLAAADSAAFYDRSIEEVTENLQSFLKGNYENDAALGISATETTRNAAAMKLYGKEFNKLTEMQKQFTLLSMVEEGNKLSGALGQAARESDQFENQLGNLKQAWTDFKKVIGGPLLEPAVQGMKSLSQWIQSLDTDKISSGIQRAIEFGSTLKDTVMALFYDTGEVSDLWQNFGFSKETSDAIAGIGEILKTTVATGIEVTKTGFEALRTGIQWMIDHKDAVISVGTGLAAGFAAFKVASTVSAGISLLSGALTAYRTAGLLATTAQLGLNTAMLASPITWVAVGFGVLVAAGIALYRNWDTIKLKAGELWTKVQEVFGGIYNWGVTKIQAVVGFFQGLYNKFVQFRDALSNYTPPQWVSTIGGAIGKGISWVANKINGSHASGLNKVPFDGYIAELHKGEMVIPARQSERLRQQGYNINNVDRAPITTTNTTNNTKAMNKIEINIYAQNMTTAQVMKELMPQLKIALANL